MNSYKKDQESLSNFEKRKYKRYSFIRPCWCDGSDFSILARITNISGGGAFLKTGNPLPIGSHAIITFKLKFGNKCQKIEQDQIIAEVEIVWHLRGPQILKRTVFSGMGMKIIKILSGSEIFEECLKEGQDV